MRAKESASIITYPRPQVSYTDLGWVDSLLELVAKYDHLGISPDLPDMELEDIENVYHFLIDYDQKMRAN